MFTLEELEIIDIALNHLMFVESDGRYLSQTLGTLWYRVQEELEQLRNPQRIKLQWKWFDLFGGIFINWPNRLIYVVFFTFVMKIWVGKRK